MKPSQSPPCPACKRPLVVAHEWNPAVPPGQVTVYCPHGPCDSEAANCGATGDTIDEALTALARAVDAEAESGHDQAR